MKAGNGQNLMQMNAWVKYLINDHLLKTTSVQRAPLCKDQNNNYVPKMTDDLIQRSPLYKAETTFYQRLYLPVFISSLIKSLLSESH